jgi:phosphoglucomutase
MAAPIQFGTSGWRDVLAEGFTFDNVRVLTQAIADHLNDAGQGRKGVVVASDYRFLAERFTSECCRVLAANGITAQYLGFAPTPAVAFAIIEGGFGGGINFTASHNPPEYNGMKFSPDWGGPALPETTKDIEKRANAPGAETRVKRMPVEEARAQKKIVDLDAKAKYLGRLESLVDFDAIKKLNLVYDPLYGSGRGWLDAALTKNGAKFEMLHDQRDPTFGGTSPDPSEKRLDELRARMKKNGANLGLATDGDADRFGVLDADGSFVLPNYLLAVLFDYLVGDRKFAGGAARTVSTTHLLDRVGKLHNREVAEYPVGFKYIGKAIAEGKIAIGGEESAGLSIRGHVPEKDGILACLLAAESVARRGKPILQQVRELWEKVGKVVSARVNVAYDPERRDEVAKRVKAFPVEFAGRKVVRVDETDGVKLLLADGAWFLVRLSGTEPVMRFYAESSEEKDVDRIIEDGKKMILG